MNLIAAFLFMLLLFLLMEHYVPVVQSWAVMDCRGTDAIFGAIVISGIIIIALEGAFLMAWGGALFP